MGCPGNLLKRGVRTLGVNLRFRKCRPELVPAGLAPGEGAGSTLPSLKGVRKKVPGKALTEGCRWRSAVWHAGWLGVARD